MFRALRILPEEENKLQWSN